MPDTGQDVHRCAGLIEKVVLGTHETVGDVLLELLERDVALHQRVHTSQLITPVRHTGVGHEAVAAGVTGPEIAHDVIGENPLQKL